MSPGTTTSPVPTGKTARRLEWQFLPPNLRAYVERKCGSPVVRAESQGAGFTPGFASVLTCEDGTKHFVKAASTKAQKPFATAYREEARKLAALPAGVPAPRLRFLLDDDWVVLGIEYVEGRNPARPWRPADLHACLDVCETMAETLTPAPAALGLATFADDLADWPAMWDHVRAARAGGPDAAHVEEAAALAASYASVVGGDTVVHTDVRDDNFLIEKSGRVWLIGPRGDGLDVDQVIRERPLLRDVPAESIDVALALVTGYFLRQADEPVPPSSPYIRQHQAWQGEVCWSWLGERRGWA